MKLRWGICTAGMISNDFTLALSLLPAEDHAVVAVAARSEADAKKFAEKHKIPVAYGGYDALAGDADVDIVYIGACIHVHLPLCKLFLGQGKHVLCENPLALNKREVKEIIDLAKEKNVFLMEGMAEKFFPANVKLRELLAAGHIGEVKSVVASSGAPFMTFEKLRLKEFGGGGLLQMGVHLVQETFMTFGQAPTSWSTKGFLAETGVDETTVTTLLFPNNAVASLTCSVVVNLANEFEIRGTKGYIKIPELFCRPSKLEVTTAEQRSDNPLDLDWKTEVMEFPLLSDKEGFEYDPDNAGLKYEAEAVRQCLMKGLKECPNASHKESLLVHEIIQSARHDVGYLLEADKERVDTMPCQ